MGGSDAGARKDPHDGSDNDATGSAPLALRKLPMIDCRTIALLRFVASQLGLTSTPCWLAFS
jgi:hypothetical protein